MNRSLINAFLADQRKAKSIVASRLNIEPNIKALEWASRLSQIRDAYNADPFADIFKPHGFGLELQIGDLYVDYDYSETGRADGFDAWRILVHITAGRYDNNGPDKHLSDRIDAWFSELTQTGQIAKLDNLYYFVRRRDNGAEQSGERERD